ncbi:D-aminoacyl-tRNA deacylase [Anaeromicropila herbilytica]|uniref:D-aminoacyl-tRNA deacylase n=1 Tax=Anaeromicropila herbilytica TaxID=2785025 RepID=A0A7R7ID63_9FIRM|nr:D-aminoacyl-tRNA deacylase [Anaeromicropila herbilytica]BCN29708.1 D-aminoacyl-tRNA deacylase [Anaeromicropila herbilytica]
MRIVIQRVKKASVQVNEKVIGEINHGLLVLLGVGQDDTEEDLNYLVNKLIGMRIFEDNEGKMNCSIQDVKGSLLIISQFTLFANCKKGNRPNFMEAGDRELSFKLYKQFIQRCKDTGIPTEQGEFGADMDISLINQGPVTITLDSRNR